MLLLVFKFSLFDISLDEMSGVCTIVREQTNIELLNTMNYVYNLFGISIPCLILFSLSFVILYRNRTFKHSYRSIAAFIGICHSLFNLPARISDILLLYLSPYSTFYSSLMYFNHEIQSILFFSYTYKCLICIMISHRYRFYAKRCLCFLIENHTTDRNKVLTSYHRQLKNSFVRDMNSNILMRDKI